MQLNFRKEKEQKMVLNLDDYRMVEDIFSTNQKFQEFDLVKKDETKRVRIQKSLSRLLAAVPKKVKAGREEATASRKGPFWTKKRVRLTAIGTLVVLLPVLSFAVVEAFPRDALEVVYCDEVIGTVRSEKDFYKALEAAESSAEEAYGHAVVMQDEASFVETKVDSKEISSTKELTEAISETVQFAVESAAILEDSDVRCVVADASVAEEVLKEVLAAKKGDQYDEASFAKNVTVDTAFAVEEDILEKDEAISKLLGMEESQKPYEVQESDTLWDISERLGVSLDKLTELNPGLGDDLSIGQEIIIEAPEPVISVSAKARRELEEEIPFETKKVEDNTMAKGKTAVDVKGVPGKKRVVADITYLNDAETAREVLSEEVLTEPVTEVVRVGTLTTAATGSFSMPAYGSYTSRFGRRWGSTHTGLDIGASYGSPVSAADGGVVEFAGWSGGYGNLVRVNHGNGYVTYYAHMSKITVSKGQRVAKGQQVGKVGSTGNSTGPHLHFEIRKNGQILNPENFLRK